MPAIPLGGTSLQLQVTVLPPTGLACPECVQGALVGVLDDGLGGIDFLVDGTYHGFALGGEAGGEFRLAVRHADGRRAGWIRGRFEDLGPGPGTFRAGVLLGR